MTPSDSDCLTAALDYAARGWRVLPLCRPTDLSNRDAPACRHHKGCGTNSGKRPLVAKWQDAAATDPETIRRWWARWPDANVGVALGSKSGVVAVDIDSDEGAVQLQALCGGTIPSTAEIATGNGGRLLYAVPEALEYDPATQAGYKGADGRESLRLQSTGAQCVMPPSLHYSGKLYHWVEGLAIGVDYTWPANLPPGLCAEMCPAPPDAPGFDFTPPAPESGANAGRSAAADFNARADWFADVLEPAGFKFSARRGEVDHYTRPDKAGGTSVTVGHFRAKDGTPALYVFSGSIAGLDAQKCYDKFGCYARLFHKGEFAAAAKALAGLGYGPARPTGSGKTVSLPARVVDAIPDRKPAPGEPAHRGALVWKLASQIKRKRVDWLWHSRLPLGMLTIIDGDPALGKSGITVDIAARVTTGRDMPHSVGTARPAADVVFLCAEDDYARTVRPRLEASGADLGRCSCVFGVGPEDDPLSFNLLDDLPLLEQRVVESGATLVVIDPILSFLDGRTDTHKDQSVREALGGVKRLAERTGCAVLGLRHLNKKAEGPAIYRGGGSIAFTATARMQLTVGRDPDGSDDCVLCVSKTNLTAKPRAIHYGVKMMRLDPLPDDEDRSQVETSMIEWGELGDLSADEMLNQPADRGRPARESKRAEDFLRDLLEPGPMDSARVFELGEAEGLTEITLKRAKKVLGIEAVKSGYTKGAWAWRLPVTKSANLEMAPGETQADQN